MKALLVVVAFLSLFVGSLILGEEKAGPAGDVQAVLVRPDTVKWGPAPVGLPKGSEMAVLVGDPKKPAPFVLRAKMPDGYRVPPHWHSSDENITVLKGSLMVGHGEHLDPSAMEEAPAGSFWHMPAGMRHVVVAKGESIIQIHGTGPFDITYVNPADDPRAKEEKK